MDQTHVLKGSLAPRRNAAYLMREIRIEIMGLDYCAAEFLIERSKHAPLGRTLILGRQNVYMTHREAAQVHARTGAKLRPQEFADDFFRAIGGTELVFLDRAAYEGAEFVHDLNQPLPDGCHSQFDTVIDGGTLEHVFNFPIALKTCMEAVKEGGRFFSFPPANNMMGHGFYQFTPELFYRCFAADYGFEVERLLIRHNGTWFEAIDPSAIGARGEASTPKSASIAVSARRIHLAPIFEPWPIQSDYANPKSPATSNGAESSIKDHLTVNFPIIADLQAKWRKIKGANSRRLANRVFFRKIGSSLRS